MITMKITGLKEADAMLSQLSKSVQKRVLTKALLAGGEIVARSARAKAPVLTGRLREYIDVTDKRPDDADVGAAAFGLAKQAGLTGGQAGQVARAANVAAREYQAQVWVGASKRVAEAWPQEVGTVHHAAQPYLRPAFEETKSKVADTIAFEIFAGIESALRRRAAKG